MSNMVSTIERDNEIRNLLSVLSTLYRPPVSQNDPKFKSLTALYDDGLKRFDAATLKAGIRRFTQEWTYQRWPNLGELIGLLNAVRDELYPPEHKKPDRPPALDRPTYSPEHKARMVDGLRRIHEGLENGYCDQMTEAEWYAWCKHGVVPERLKEAS